MKNRIPCNYAVVRFLPYPEAGEFVNIGVVVHSPRTGFFDFLLEVKRTRRVNGFFPEMEGTVFKGALRNCYLELKRMRDEIGINGRTAAQVALDPENGIGFFRDLVRPRETVIRFSSGGTALALQPEQLLRELFERYVRRMFAIEPEYQEEIMQRRVAATLRAHKLITRYRPAKIGNRDYHVTFPFVYQPRIGLFARSIKPLNLGQSESTKIYDHGDEWMNRIRRLRRMDTVPNKMLFAVRAPETANGNRRRAFDQVCAELAALDVEVVPERDHDAILRFAEDMPALQDDTAL